MKLTIPSLNHHYQTLFTNRKPCAVFSWNVHSIILTSLTFHQSTLLPSCDTPSPPTSTSSYDVQISAILQDPDQRHLSRETSPDSHNSLQTPEALHLGTCLMSRGVGGYLCPCGLILSTRPHPCDPSEQASYPACGPSPEQPERTDASSQNTASRARFLPTHHTWPSLDSP